MTIDKNRQGKTAPSPTAFSPFTCPDHKRFIFKWLLVRPLQLFLSGQAQSFTMEVLKDTWQFEPPCASDLLLARLYIAITTPKESMKMAMFWTLVMLERFLALVALRRLHLGLRDATILALFNLILLIDTLFQSEPVWFHCDNLWQFDH